VRDIYDLGKEMLIVTTDRISAYDVVFPTLIPHKGESINKIWLMGCNKKFENEKVKEKRPYVSGRGYVKRIRFYKSYLVCY
jgi:hypothetical protein